MAEVILMPRLSDTMTEGVVAAWHKKVGDTVKKGELLAEIETDKATMELESYKDGTLLHIGSDKGGKLQVNDLLAIIGAPGEDISSLLKNGAAPAKSEAPKKEEEAPAKETKAPAPVNALRCIIGEEGKVEVDKIVAASKGGGGSATASVAAPAPQKEEAKADVKESESAEVSSTENGRVKASPLAKKLAAEKGIDIAKVQGSGDGGRIIKSDIDNFKEVAAPAASVSKSAAPAAASVPSGQVSFEE